MNTAKGPGLLALHNGRVYPGTLFGAAVQGAGEVVFNTAMTGYPEVLTDPSYRGQMVAMTYPEIGNYGLHPSQGESARAHVAGFIVRSLCERPSSWLNKGDLSHYLRKQGIPGIQGVDTRDLTIHIRDAGVPRAVIVPAKVGKVRAIALAKAVPDISERDCVAEVSCRKPYLWKRGPSPFGRGEPALRSRQLSIDGGAGGEGRGRLGDRHLVGDRHLLYPGASPPPAFSVAAVDCGIKFNILRELTGLGCKVTVLPSTFRAEEVLNGKYDGLFLSNGPGDPKALPDIVEQVRSCLGRIPTFGICLGHQMIGRALGCRTFKLGFGHHGGNHPVKNFQTGKVEITVQNHNYCVDGDDLLRAGAEITHLNLNDRTVEGMRHKTMPVFSVQYHPEAAPGPHDSRYLFGDFLKMMRSSEYRVAGSERNQNPRCP